MPRRKRFSDFGAMPVNKPGVSSRSGTSVPAPAPIISVSKLAITSPIAQRATPILIPAVAAPLPAKTLGTPSHPFVPLSSGPLGSGSAPVLASSPAARAAASLIKTNATLTPPRTVQPQAGTTAPVNAATPAVQAAAAAVSSGPMYTQPATQLPSGGSETPVNTGSGGTSSSGGGSGGGGGGGGSGTYEESPEGPTASDYYDDGSTGAVIQPTTDQAQAAASLVATSTALAKAPSSLPVLASTAAAPTKNIFRRIWEFFFGAKDAAPATAPASTSPPIITQSGTTVHGDPIASGAADLVIRSRAGDQNAMAMIDMIRRNATTGIPAAKRSYAALVNFIKNNPAPGTAEEVRTLQVAGEARGLVGRETAHGSRDASVMRAAARLANGPRITTHRIAKFGADRSATGRALIEAQKLQEVRRPGSLISAYNSMVGWELGE